MNRSACADAAGRLGVQLPSASARGREGKQLTLQLNSIEFNQPGRCRDLVWRQASGELDAMKVEQGSVGTCRSRLREHGFKKKFEAEGLIERVASGKRNETVIRSGGSSS